MKKIVIVLVLFALLVAGEAYAKVFTRLQLVSNDNGVLVVDVQAFSNYGTPLISFYRGSFKISKTLEKRVTSVSFVHYLFPRPAYTHKYGYSTAYNKVTWTYIYDKNAQKPYSSIGKDWVTVLRVIINYNTSDEKATLSWAGSPSYLVLDAGDRDITGDYYPIPGNLQDIPLPVQLSLFKAEPIETGSVRIEWRTETEVNNLGFNLYRSSREDEGFERINKELILGQGTSSVPRQYVFEDEPPADMNTAWYLVESISTEGVSTFEGPVAAALSSAKSSLAPASFDLISNYPNPFNPTTEIRYRVDSAADVSLTIYSLSGKMVKSLFSGFQNEGTFRISWDGRNADGSLVDSGIYICELRIGERTIHHKMTLIK
ncbi:MAG: T9SS type A sorting domain-containing protein [candidate division KSB1 bacterium]|nr:T9SS type A sorting domain-containing protein [candidate division KSB1 bacterium]MDZ7346003.1 T9SS type A sorting domain-containing protein [candidate division KSB1 bacterium]